MISLRLTLILAAASAAPVFTQPSRPAFEVADIRPANPANTQPGKPRCFLAAGQSCPG